MTILLTIGMTLVSAIFSKLGCCLGHFDKHKITLRNSLEEVSKDTYPEMTLHLLICISKMAATQLSAFFIWSI